MKLKMNARLEWRGRKLMCNGVAVIAEIYRGAGLGGLWYTIPADPLGHYIYETKPAARRAINRRFGIKEDERG
jgi:hypothetical protein